MIPRNVARLLLSRMIVFLIGLAFLHAIVACGGGGGGGVDPPPPKVTISGTVDDGTENSPISNAECTFFTLNGIQDIGIQTGVDALGNFSIEMDPEIEGYIQCYPKNNKRLILSNFISTRDRKGGDRISGEDVNPSSTVFANIIDSENAAAPRAREEELKRDLETGQDPDLSRVVFISTQLYKSMLKKNVNVDFGGGEGGGNGGGGGVGGEGGDGGVTSPIANARCEFIVSSDLEKATVLQSAALADFLDDGMINRPDLNAVKDEINILFQGREEEVKASFAKFFPSGLGKSFFDITDAQGNYFIENPPNVPGYVRCLPPNQEKLVLATYVPARSEGVDLNDQDVNPATTVFSTKIASKLSGDLSIVKQNYLDEVDGLNVYIREKERDGANVLFYSLCEPSPGAVSPPDNCIPDLPPKADNDVVMVAFSATALFNSFFKNGIPGDYLAALENLTTTGDVNPPDLEKLGMPIAQGQELDENVTGDAATALDTGLGLALSTARIAVTVTDGGLIAGAEVDIQDSGLGIFCENCPGTTDSTGQVTLELSGVPSTPTDITVTVNATGFEEKIVPPIKVVALATVDLDVSMTPFFNLTVQGAGDGAGTVTNGLGDISCAIDGANDSGSCSSEFVSGTQVTLTASADAGSTFAGWSGGGCSGTVACTVIVDQAKTVTATFILEEVISHTLTVNSSGTGSGVVSSVPSGISCGADCSQDYVTDTTVLLTADPAAGSTFAGWSGGGCSGTGSCTVTMDQARIVTATFSAIPDIVIPEVAISSPSSDPFTAENSSLSISGTASDNVGVTQVTWSNSQGGSGICNGTNSWSATGITLSVGTNVITITAIDAANNQGVDSLTVNYQETIPLIWDSGIWDRTVWN